MHIIKTSHKKKGAFWSPFFSHLFKDHIFESSATLSYYFLFSIFPLAIFVSAAFATLHLSPETMSAMNNIIPEPILAILSSYLREISLGNPPTLMITGVVLTLYSMGKAIQTMKRKLRNFYGYSSKAASFKDGIISFVFVLLIQVSFYATLILIVAGNYILSWVLDFAPQLAELLPSIHLFRIFVVTAYLFFVLLGLYWILPGIQQKRRDVLPGTLLALSGWVLMSWIFSFYIDRTSDYATLYGSLGTIIALLTWLFLINFILLLGGSLNSFLFLRNKK